MWRSGGNQQVYLRLRDHVNISLADVRYWVCAGFHVEISSLLFSDSITPSLSMS